ncbi:hypothetical protein MMC07_008771 [Pseudocyphellaria aurata]|nr:hypothetical protein [Pseudocyphellaria aurata]
MIWDQKFLRNEDLYRYVRAPQNPRISVKLIDINYSIVRFANEVPHLAKHVRDLLVRIPPDNNAPEIDDLEKTRTFLRMTGISSSKNLTETHEYMYYKLVVEPLSIWKTDAEDKVRLVERAIGRAYRQTFSCLPNLRRIETAISKHYYQYFSWASNVVVTRFDIFLENTHNAEFTELSALTNAYCLIAASCPRKVTSLKFSRVLLMENLPGLYPLPTHLQEIIMEFHIPREYLAEGDAQRSLGKAVGEWREQLENLPRLRSLSIDFCGSWEEIHELTLLKENAFYIDRLLPCKVQETGDDRDSRAAPLTLRPAFLKLRHLTIRNIPANPFALIKILLQHQNTLKTLSLHRVSLDTITGMDWTRTMSELAKRARNVPRLDLRRIGTHKVGWFNQAGESIPKGAEDESDDLMVVHKLLNDQQVDRVYRSLSSKSVSLVYRSARGTAEDALAVLSIADQPARQ